MLVLVKRVYSAFMWHVQNSIIQYIDTFPILYKYMYACVLERAVPKFMKRIKVRDYKDRNVFGVPLQVIVQRSGQPLPLSIQQAMRYLRSQCLDQVRRDTH